MKLASKIGGICLLIQLACPVAFCASREQQMVTRVDTATAVLKHRRLVIRADGMGRTPSGMGRGGRLLRRGNLALNKDGLLEYDMVFNGVANYTGFTLKPVRASLKERSVPEGIKGARIFGQYNQVDALLPEPTKRKSFLPFGRKPKDETAKETTGSITEGSPHPQR